LDDPWTGGSIPAGQQCRAEGGSGAIPAIRIAGLPDDTAAVRIAVNDVDDPALATGGGHGVVEISHSDGGPVMLTRPIPGETATMLPGVTLVSPARVEGAVGYLPPCGRQSHLYVAEVTALRADGVPLAAGTLRLGRY
ncbi:MAG: hypothetical protein AAFZ09_20160, partial [Pseudomonadota bacterium]